MASKRFSFSVNPLWPHYAALSTIVFGLSLGLLQFFVLDRSDPLHCGALLNEGSWLGDGRRNWQPEGCMLHSYQTKDASTCLASRQVVFIGDSVTRKLFFQFGQVIDNTLPKAPTDDQQKHSDHSLRSKAGTRLEFYWDPYLNTTHTQNLLNPPKDTVGGGTGNTTEGSLFNKPSLLVIGSGLWYLRYPDSGGLSAWEAKIESTVDALTRGPKPADEVVLLPVEEVVPAKLSRERASSMQLPDIDAMNSDLFHRIHPPQSDSSRLFSAQPLSLPISMPLVFNKMLDSTETEDGLHFSDKLVKIQANILLNLRCNDGLPKIFPLDKTCCRAYPRPSSLQIIILAVAILWGPYTMFSAYQSGQITPGGPLIMEEQTPALVFSAAIALIYLADRTGFWLKEQKDYNPWIFAFLTCSWLVVGLVTIKRTDKDLGFLNREQTDEWKGWMQLAILVYHYLGASKVSGIYNPIRVLVAAYLFMTGYGHTTFYIKKADFGFLRIAQVMVRLNFLTLVLAYTMNTDYISYYFAPLVSWWFLIIYATMAIGSQFNDRTPVLVGKILFSMALVTYFMHESWLLQAVFDFLNRFCGIKWSAREWAFRVNLDLWIVYFGMFASIAVLKIREYRLMDHPHWPLALKAAIVTSGLVMVWFFAFELWQENKFIYNGWHPYISFLPIAAFVVLRNANPILRSASSRMFAFIGTCSLETFIIQYHFWLAGDTKGVLLVIPGTVWRPVNFILTSIMFVYVSHRVAQATGVITAWICNVEKKSLPTVNIPTSAVREGPSSSTSRSTHHEAIPLVSRDDVEQKGGEDTLPPEPDTPIRPVRRWVDRLADEGQSSSSRGLSLWYNQTEWKPGVKTKLIIGMGLMWIVNMMWQYP